MTKLAARLLDVLPVRDGHFLLESGYHANSWLTLDGLFVDPEPIRPLVLVLATQIRAHGVSAVCGPMIGGAFLAQQLAGALDAKFYYTRPGAARTDAATFTATYHLPEALRNEIRGQSVAVVDDVISAGSSVRATVKTLTDAGASIPVVGALMLLGDVGRAHFVSRDIAVETLAQKAFAMWAPNDCPLCKNGVPLETASSL